MTADRTPLPEPGTRVLITRMGEATVIRNDEYGLWADPDAEWACGHSVPLNHPGVTWEPVEPREWADGDVVVCWVDGYAIAWTRQQGWWRPDGDAVDGDAVNDASIDIWLTRPEAWGWAKVRAVVRGGVDV